MRNVLLVALLIIFHGHGKARGLIDIQVRKGDSVSIAYYPPFDGFANNSLKENYPKVSGHLDLGFTITQPTFIRLGIDNVVLELLVEPNDTVRLMVSSPLRRNWITFSGHNAAGHSYYNLKYNFLRANKLYNMSDVFEANIGHDKDRVLAKIETEINRNTLWVDSLLLARQITRKYAEYAKTQIRGILTWQVGELCRKHSASEPVLKEKLTFLKRSLFDRMDMVDSKIRRCLAAGGFYNMYYSEMYGDSVETVGQDKIIVHDTPFYAFAPMDLQKYLWGSSLYAHFLFDPDKKGNCESYQRYKSIFTDSPFLETFENGRICVSSEKQEGKIIKFEDSDLFTFLQMFSFRKRSLIDLWATWCAPCKMEFAQYDSAFFGFMDKHRIKLLYISLDKEDHRLEWEKQIKMYNLKGDHTLAGPKMTASIKEVIFDGSPTIIPRYVLVDESGKIISVDFARPSNPSFRSEIKKAFPQP